MSALAHLGRITLLGQPQSTNHIYKSVCVGKSPRVYLTKEGKDLKEDYRWQVRSRWRVEPLEIPLKLTCVLFFGDKRRRDWDNYHKLSMDALNGIVWVDDSQVKEVTVRVSYDKKNPRIEIVFWAFDAEF